MLYTLVETAKANGLEPLASLQYLFETLPTVTRPDGFEALLPHRLTPDAYRSKRTGSRVLFRLTLACGRASPRERHRWPRTAPDHTLGFCYRSAD
jgi:hypothetical protein